LDSLGENCDSKEKIAEYFNSLYIDVIVNGEYFDPDDFDNPVKAYSFRDAFVSINTNTSPKSIFFIRKNQYIINDSIFGFPWSEKKGDFYSVERGLTTQGDLGSGVISDIIYKLDREMYVYERRVVTILEVLSSIGGMFEIILYWPGIIFAICQRNTLNKMIIGAINKRQEIQANNFSNRENIYKDKNDADNNGLSEKTLFEDYISKFDQGSIHWISKMNKIDKSEGF
jgi:hypothetical protein